MRAVRDLKGQRFGMLTVLEFSHVGNGGGLDRSARWKCQCDCGVIKVFASNKLTKKKDGVVSCGKHRGELHTTHGHASPQSPTYRSWYAMIRRCTSPNSPKFPLYGGRGIKVCRKWVLSFEAFLYDMGERPEGKTLNRIDNDGNYEPKNCQWSTPKEQAQNRRKRKGKTKCAQ